ncbi:hypothetical protein [Lysobacter tyrosinilyticus]
MSPITGRAVISILRSTCLVVSLVLLAASVTQSRNAFAAGDSTIQRCEAEDGNAVYTDKPCAQFQAQPTRMSSDLSFRLAMAEAAEAASVPTLSLGPYRDASEPLEAGSREAPPSPPGRRSAAAGCAHSPQQLSQDLVGAFALHDVNRVAESYHWAGMNQRQALPVMKRLEKLSARPLADARYLAAWIRSSDEESDAAAVSTKHLDSGMMQLVFAGGERVIDFNVRRYSGCYFIAT